MLPTPENTAELIEARRTIHGFKPEAPDKVAIEKAIDLARWAPNHRYTEPWRIYQLGPETVANMLDIAVQLVEQKRGAEIAVRKRAQWQAVPQWIAVTQTLSGDALERQEDYASCACAIQNMQLYLWSAGIGVKWTTGPVTRSPELLELLWADPENEQVVGLLQLGYPVDVPNSPRKPVSDYSITLP